MTTPTKGSGEGAAGTELDPMIREYLPLRAKCHVVYDEDGEPDFTTCDVSGAERPGQMVPSFAWMLDRGTAESFVLAVNAYDRLTKENERLRAERDSLQTALRAWYEVFETTQLTHARARLERAEAERDHCKAALFIQGKP